MAETNMAKAETRAGVLGKETQEKGKKPLIKKLAGNLAVRLALAGIALAGTGYAVYENVPAVHRAVEDIQTWFNPKDKVIPSTFDNKADIQTVAPGINTITLSLAELHSVLKGSIKPVEAGKYPDEAILFPVKVGNQKITSSTAYINGMLNPFTEKQEYPGVRGKILRIPTKGTEIIVPVEGAEVFQLTPRSEGSVGTYFTGVVVRFKGPDGAFHYINIEPSNYKLGEVVLLDTIKNAPFIGTNGLFAIPNAETDALKGMPLAIGTSILKTDIGNAGVHLVLATSSPILPAGGVRSPFSFVIQEGKIAIIP